jgi:hypothetical protein
MLGIVRRIIAFASALDSVLVQGAPSHTVMLIRSPPHSDPLTIAFLITYFLAERFSPCDIDRGLDSVCPGR